MFKFAVLFAVLAVAAAKPGYLHGGAAVVAAPVAHVAHAVPAAVSHSSRTDFISSPVVAHTAVAAPVVAHAAIAAPVVAHHAVAAPVVAHTAHIATPVLGHAAYAAPIGHLGLGHLKVHHY